MKTSRRTFLKIAGTSLLVLGAEPALEVFAGKEVYQPDPKALQGKRWAMAVIGKKCPPDCRDCITACHATHNVPDFGNPKDEIKWIWTEPTGHVFPSQENHYLGEAAAKRSLVVLCNHCENPPCVRVCPTKATFKRQDGIVMMDYHRCIGCRFCMAGCPYGARSMNFRDPRPFIKKINADFPTRTKGVVEKCNFCAERLAAGLLPACVEACKEKALVFGDLANPQAAIHVLLKNQFTIRRRPELGTQPQVYYIM